MCTVQTLPVFLSLLFFLFIKSDAFQIKSAQILKQHFKVPKGRRAHKKIKTRMQVDGVSVGGTKIQGMSFTLELPEQNSNNLGGHFMAIRS